MRVVAPPEVADLVREHGGRLFVWADPHRCCGGSVTFLKTAPTSPPGERRFILVDAEGFELHFDPGRVQPPDELHFAVKGWHRKRVEAYWNGCVYAL
jgi:hypothetical protein